jgi:thioesterase domain-containing protein
LPPDVKQKFFQRLAAELHNLYGPTEAAVDVTYWNCANESPCATVPIGRPISNVKAYILDRNLAPVPIGVAGELYIGGVALASGYLNRLQLTAERFIADPFEDDPSARLYKTGDRTRFLADGNIEYLGRLDNQVKLRGFRIEVGEIESAILQWDGVQSAVVALREDSAVGKYLAAYVVPAVPGLDSQEIRAFLKERLPDYMIPSHFVFLETLPLLSNGKVNRKALPVPHLASVASEQYVAPGDAIERKLVAIWEELLGAHPIGVNHNFFELGGHSMLLARLLHQVEQAFQQRLSIASVFQRPTIAGLAHLLRNENASQHSCRVFPIQPSGTLPPFICLGAGPYFLPLARHLGSDQPVMGVDISQLEIDKLPAPLRLQDLAAHIVKAIREFQPHGPYYLGGWCLWGVLMYEVAQQIIAEGGEVALLVMFDSLYPTRKTKISRLARLQASIQKSIYHATLVARSRVAEIPAYLSQRITLFRGRLLSRLQRLEYLRAIQQADGPLEMKLDPVIFAATNYEPLPYPGDVALFQAVERPSGWYWDLRNAWSELIRGSFKSHDIVGGHDGMFREPFVAVLGSELKNSLERAQRNGKHAGPDRQFAGVVSATDPFSHRAPTNGVHR